MAEQEPKQPEPSENPARERSPDEVRTTNPDEIFADWSDIRIGRAIPYLLALLAAGFALVVVLILIGIL